MVYHCFNLINRITMSSNMLEVLTYDGKFYKIVRDGVKFYLVNENGNTVEVLHFYSDCKSLMLTLDNIPEWLTCYDLSKD